MIIKIEAFKNGGHANQGHTPMIIPEGWAVVPEDMDLPNFPFGKVTVKEIDGVMTVTKWVAGTIPKPEEPELPVTPTEQLRADIDYLAIMTGVEL